MAEASYGPAVTVSASYGAGGSVIAPRLAESLGIPFIDRMIAASAIRSQEGLVAGERDTTPAGRFFSYFAGAAPVGGVVPPDLDIEDDETIRTKAEAALQPLADGAPGVVLGRAGAVVLAARPRAYHIRLDGPVERRLVWAAALDNMTEEIRTKRQVDTDRARTQYVKHLYRRDPRDPALYHLVLDPTVLGIDAAIEVIRAAAEAFFRANP